MSISQSGNEVETAAGRDSFTSNAVTENGMIFEATEDRLVLGAKVHSNQADSIAEVSFSNSMLLDSVDTDETASGLLAFTQGAISGVTAPAVLPEDAAPIWDAGEEINVHCDNAGGSAALVTVLIWYIPIGEFRRERLRNR